MLFKSILSLAALATSAFAKIAVTSYPTTGVTVGSTYQITWTGAADGPVTIVLRRGPSTNLKDVETLTTNGVGGAYSWTPESSLVDGSDYAIHIVQGTDDNYSGLFSVSGGSGVASATSSVSSAALSVSTTLSSAASSSSAAAASSSSSSSSSSESSAASSSSAAALSSAAASSSASSASSSASSASRTSASTSATSSVPASGASGLQSPIAFILCAVAAMLYLN